MSQREIEGKLTRMKARREAKERLNAFNAEQVYTGRCRVCKTHWEGRMAELPRQCVNCGAGNVE